MLYAEIEIGCRFGTLLDPSNEILLLVDIMIPFLVCRKDEIRPR